MRSIRHSRLPHLRPGLTAMLGLVACGSGQIVGPNPQIQDTTTIVVDNRVSLQTVDGFGGTTLTLVYGSEDYLGSYRSAAIRRAFGDVGVSLGLLSAGVVEAPSNATDPFGQRANDNADPLAVNPAGFNFVGSDKLREKIIVPAAAYGFDDLTLGSLLNLSGPLSWLVAIRNADYQRYLDEAAEHVLALLEHWRTAYGLTPRLIQLFNEPTSGNRELESSSIQEVVDLVKRIGVRLQGAGFGEVKFLVPNEETISRSYEVAQAILSDPAARPYVGAIGYHPYPSGSAYSSVRRILEASGSGTPDPAARQELEQVKALGQQYGVPIWLTEVNEGVGRSDYGFDAIENVLARAIHIHDNFRYAGASAYFGMLTIWDSRSHAEHFAGRNVPFLTEKSGMLLVDLDDGRILTTGMAYAVGHYARWIRRGAIRIAATSDRARVMVTAFRDPARGRLVVVVVNNEETNQLVQVRLQGAVARSATGEVSYGSKRWEPIGDIAPAGEGEIRYVTPARSVLTLAVPIG